MDENDLCELQNDQRERNKKKRTDRLKARSEDKQNFYCNEFFNTSTSDTELAVSKSKDYNPLLTNTDRSWIITQIQNRRRGRQSLQEYLRKNHEIFTLQYTLNVKQNEIEHLDQHLREQERALVQSEKYLIEDIALFDQFLEAWNRNASHAASRAEDESRKKEELVNEIKRLQKILLTYRNDQNHLIDILRQYRRYQQFLFKFAPEEWRDDVLLDMNKTSESDISKPTDENDVLYFTKPEQLLEIFTEMEEKSLPLVQKSQSTSEAVDQIQLTINQTIIDQEQQVEQLQMKITQLEERIKHEIDREISCQNILIEYKNSKDEPLIEQIKTTIENLYKKYLTSDDIGLSPIHMLQTIENQIKSLFNQIENLDSVSIIEAEKSREITVRTMDYQEKVRQEKLINDQKRQKALLRASALPYPKIGRKLMERSRPLDKQQKYQIKHSRHNKQEQWMRLLED